MMNSTCISRGIAAALLSLSALPLLSGCGSSAPAKPLSELPPKQILAEALAAAKSSGPMYYKEYVGTVSSSTASLIASGGGQATTGRQVVQSDTGAVMTELVLPTGTYVKGNAAALTGFLGMTATAAAQLANRWIVLQHSFPKYNQITEGVTGQSVLSLITPVGALTKAKKLTKVSGQSVVVIYGAAPASSEMGSGATDSFYVAVTGKPLPVATDEISTNGSDNEFFFTRSWGKSLTNVAAPAGAVPYPAG
jgi:hypothetical protein